MQRESRSPWSFVRIGCVALLAASAVAFVAFIFVGQRMARSIREQMADPGLRLAKVRELLGATELPEGFEPALGVSVPLLGQVAVLEGAAEPSKLFLYLHSRSASADGWRDELHRLLDLRGLEIEPGELLAEGQLAVRERMLTYRSIRARLKQRPRGEWSVLATLVEVRCREEEEAVRFGAWIEPDPTPERTPEEPDLAGTPADPEAIGEFMSFFNLCFREP
jgi:hypothetical protein